MKKVVTSVYGRIALALLAVAIIVLVAVAVSGGNKPSEENQVADNDVVTIQTEEVPLADTPVEEASKEEPAETEPAVASDNATTESTEGAAVKGEKRTTTTGNNNSTVAKATTNENSTSVVKPVETTNVVKTANATNSGNASGETGSTESNTNSGNAGNDSQSEGNKSQGSGSSASTSAPAPGSSGAPSIEMSEAERYYSESGKIVSIVDAATSPDNLTETEVADLLAERGFTKYPITYEYAMGGEYTDDAEVTGNASICRPMYETDYISSNGELWHIFVINGKVITNPVSYNLHSTHPVQLLVSEANELTSYDDETNKYFVTVPYDSTVIVKVIDRIDADTLNGITSEEIDGL
ncbi:hypothetical protein [Butyrivibrio sp. VCB2006]|uniref:hypothetical protein n=1 Tax=Butyrivibrio sp. VCB2006 TaxID=1280679 RepID=UPI00040AC1F9|nr:hypothetical protein [Butyrivibrio sp. VCB2006]